MISATDKESGIEDSDQEERDPFASSDSGSGSDDDEGMWYV